MITAAQGGPTLVGDILGDWREEAVHTNASHDELIVFTTDRPTATRLYTPAHNPAYRNAMTFKGYLQSHHVDYFLGAGMTRPPRPDIAYAGGGPLTWSRPVGLLDAPPSGRYPPVSCRTGAPSRKATTSSTASP